MPRLFTFVIEDNAARARTSLQVARLVAALFGALHAWISRHAVNPGGVSHLDMTDAVRRGDFGELLNGAFSPLYTVVLAPLLALFRPGPANEAAVAHLANFLIYLFAMVTFERFLFAVRRLAGGDSSIPGPLWIAFGYACFIWSAVLIPLGQLTGDMLAAAFAYLAGALVAGMLQRPPTVGAAAMLGLALGLAYLSKTAMLPLSAVILASALVARWEWRQNFRPLLIAAIVFLCVAMPFIVALSVKKGRPTAGDIGKLVYAWFVLDVPTYAHWQGDNPPGYGTPAHPDRKLHSGPDVFEYGSPLGGTLPLFYDPSYWHEGLEVPIDLKRIVRAQVVAAKVYWEMFVQSSAELLALAALLFWTGARAAAGRLTRFGPVLVPALAAFPMFALIHTEPRFVAGFMVMALVIALAAVRLPAERNTRQLAMWLLLAATIAIGIRAVVYTASMMQYRGMAHPAYDLATSLHAAGVQRGEKAGVIGVSFDAYWARLAGVQIIAEVPEYDTARFWSETPDVRDRIYGLFTAAGVDFLVSFSKPPQPVAGWRPVDRTGVFIYDLRPPPSRSSRE